MSRVINTDGPGKRRSQNMRTAAELLRRLSQKASIDDETRDMVAMLIYCLRDIDEGIDESAQAWEKRDYWMKSEEFRQRWSWSGDMADEVQAMVFEDEWQRLPEIMIRLLPRFSGIKINKFMRKPSLWAGAYKRLLEERTPLK
jgi:hypothetical protein